MRPSQIVPHPILQPYVVCLWSTVQSARTVDVLPDGYIELIFTVGAPMILEDGPTHHRLPSCYVVGLLDHAVRIHTEGTVRIVAVRFYAWGLYPLVHLQSGHATMLAGISETVATFGSVWQTRACAIQRALQENGVESALTLLHAFLFESALDLQLGSAASAASDLHLAAAADLLQQTQGQIGMQALADACHVSRRQLERIFDRATGTSPKQMARRLRFQQVRDALWRYPDASLAALAQTCGYADQAHLQREFMALAGRTPRQFANEINPARQLNQVYDVAFVQ